MHLTRCIEEAVAWADRRDAFRSVLALELQRVGVELRGISIGRDERGGMWLVTVRFPDMTFGTVRADIPVGVQSTSAPLAKSIADGFAQWTRGTTAV